MVHAGDLPSALLDHKVSLYVYIRRNIKRAIVNIARFDFKHRIIENMSYERNQYIRV